VNASEPWVPLLFSLIAFVSGSLPLSVWLGRIALGIDIRDYGDGNPGAANVWRAGGKWWGLLAILLDGFKGLFPVAIANFGLGIEGWWLVPISLAPVLGHTISPFLKFRGGKALSTTFGVWCGLTLWLGPTVLGISLAIGLAVLVVPGWAVLFGMVVLLTTLLIGGSDPTLLYVWFGNFLLLMWKHIDDLRQPPQISKGILKSFVPPGKN
jgi:glycerol-3-phosphate acyltransferase PlsY